MAVTIRTATAGGDRAAAWRIRAEVFIGEQGIAEDLERDGLDELACHLLACDGGEPVGTARIVFFDEQRRFVAPGRGVAAKIGRLAVVAHRRREGIGRALLRRAVALSQELDVGAVELSAQAHAGAFYEREGFRTVGEPYVEAGIPHRRMTRAVLTRADAALLFERRRDAWLREDLDAYLALWADDMRFQSPVHAEPLRGKAAFADLVRLSLSLSRPVRFDFFRIAVDGDAVLAEWEIEIERRDDGRLLRWRGMSTCEIRGGRIVAWREFWNPADLG